MSIYRLKKCVLIKNLLCNLHSPLSNAFSHYPHRTHSSNQARALCKASSPGQGTSLPHAHHAQRRSSAVIGPSPYCPKCETLNSPPRPCERKQSIAKLNGNGKQGPAHTAGDIVLRKPCCGGPGRRRTCTLMPSWTHLPSRPVYSRSLRGPCRAVYLQHYFIPNKLSYFSFFFVLVAFIYLKYFKYMATLLTGLENQQGAQQRIINQTTNIFTFFKDVSLLSRLFLFFYCDS